MGLWVCFNACYSTDGGGDPELSEREEIKKFARRLFEHDTDGKISGACVRNTLAGADAD